MKIPFEHFVAGENLYTRIVAPVCEKYGLTYMEFTVIMFLTNNPDCDTASQIVKRRNLTKSHVSISIRALQERGLLKCEYRNNDHRSVHLSLTDKAAVISVDGCKAQKSFAETIFDGFSPQELELLRSYMARIDSNIDAHNAVK